jgi:hypothetical protein
MHDTVVFIGRAIHGGAAKGVSFKKFSNRVKFKNSFKKSVKKILSVQAGSKTERGAGRSFSLADPR